MKNCSLNQGDLLNVTLTDAGRNQFIKPPVEGWLLVTEVTMNGGVLQGNFAEHGSKGYGGVFHPQFKLHLIVRGRHGELSPYAALKKLQKRGGCDLLSAFDQQQYKLELPGSCVELFAEDDVDAAKKARDYLAEHRIKVRPLKLFRYPKEYVNQPTGGLIEVPFYRLT